MSTESINILGILELRDPSEWKNMDKNGLLLEKIDAIFFAMTRYSGYSLLLFYNAFTKKTLSQKKYLSQVITLTFRAVKNGKNIYLIHPSIYPSKIIYENYTYIGTRFLSVVLHLLKEFRSAETYHFYTPQKSVV